LNLATGPGSGDNGEQRKTPRDRKAANICADIGVSLQRDVERGSGVIDRAADERLHRSIAAAGVNKLHVEPVLGKVPGGARNLVRHAAQQLATIGKLDLLPLRLGGGGPCRRNDARDQRRALEHRAPRHVSLWHAGRSFVAAAHANLRTSQRRQSINLCQEPEVPAVVAATVT